jgi:hypothetical protein
MVSKVREVLKGEETPSKKELEASLLAAANAGHCRTVKLLIKHDKKLANSEVAASALLDASKVNHTPIIKVLTPHTRSPNLLTILSEVEKDSKAHDIILKELNKRHKNEMEEVKLLTFVAAAH